jgi:hypothetical protein
MKRPILAVGLVAALLSGAAPAQAYIATNGLLVQPESATTFNVPFRGRSGVSEFWCAAGDYVRNFLNMPAGTRIFRLSEPPRRGGEGIRFSLSGEGAASSTGLSIVSSGPRGSVSASTAFALCPPPFGRFR